MPSKKAPKSTIDSETEKRIVEEAPSNKKSFRNKLLLILIMFFLILGAIVAGIFVYQSKFKPENQARDEQNAQILENVRKIMVIPQGETPTIATVTDKAKLSGQIFFKKAENGDKLLIFASLNEAILYRPSENKIVNVAPLTTNPSEGIMPGESPNVSVTPVPSEVSAPAKVAVLNGTKRAGLAKSAQLRLEENSEIEISQVGNANGAYEKTIIADLTGKNTSSVDLIIKETGGKSSSLPEEENAPEGTDILVILGEDYED
jgi:hypothetical protein